MGGKPFLKMAGKPWRGSRQRRWSARREGQRCWDPAISSDCSINGEGFAFLKCKPGEKTNHWRRYFTQNMSQIWSPCLEAISHEKLTRKSHTKNTNCTECSSSWRRQLFPLWESRSLPSFVAGHPSEQAFNFKWSCSLCFVSSWLSPGMEPPLLRALAPGGPPASTHNSAKPPTSALSAGGLLKWLFTRVLGLGLCLEKNTTLLLACVYINVCQMPGCSLFVPTNSHPDLRAYCSLFFSICFIVYCS